MKYLFIVFSFSLLFSCSSSLNGENSATAEKEYEVSKVKELNISCNCNVTLVPENRNKIKIESHQNIIDNFIINNKKGSLNITETKKVDHYSVYDVYIYITDELEKLTLDNKASLKISGALSLNKLKLKLRKSAEMNQSYIMADSLDLDVSNDSKVTLEGVVKDINIMASGEAKLNLLKSKVEKIKFTANKNALIEVNVNNVLLGEAKGNSVVYFIGNPIEELIVRDNAKILRK